MIAEAKRDNRSAKLYFSVQDMFCLPYAEVSFDVVIVSNALHIVPQPEKALAEIRRVLKDDGVLIAPTFTHAENSFSGMVRAFFMKRVGFPLHSKWTSAEYLRFLSQNGWTVRKSADHAGKRVSRMGKEMCIRDSMSSSWPRSPRPATRPC